MKLKKRSFLEAYKKAFGNITNACNKIGINRQTFYNWKAGDEEFRKALESIEPEKMELDFVKAKLLQKIQAGDTTAIIFYLKARPNTGFEERSRIVNEHVVISNKFVESVKKRKGLGDVMVNISEEIEYMESSEQK